MKKPAYPHADAHILAYARLNASDFSKIQEQTNQALALAEEEHRLSTARSEARTARRAMPPLCNTGGTTIQLVLEDGEIKEVTSRVHSYSETCFIDWLHVTCHEDSFKWSGQKVTDDQVIADVSLVCEAVFGFGITAKRERGALFYQTSYDLGDNYGLVCFGGQRSTVLIQLNGTGCAAARLGWERNLYDFLNSAHQARITRVDISHDDLDGLNYTPDTLEQAFDDGLFDLRGKRPNIELRGNWKNPNGKGRTVYVGVRTGGKFFRGYEKGKQLGDPLSPWMRLEVEFKSVDRILPFDCLIFPHEYFAAAYPLLSTISEKNIRILTTRKTVEASYERTKNWLKHQCGAALHTLHQIEGDAERALSLVTREGKTPKGLTVETYTNNNEFFHNRDESGLLPENLHNLDKE